MVTLCRKPEASIERPSGSARSRRMCVPIFCAASARLRTEPNRASEDVHAAMQPADLRHLDPPIGDGHVGAFMVATPS